MNHDLDQIEQLAGALLRNLAPSARRSLFRRMARDLRRSQQERIRATAAPISSANSGISHGAVPMR